MFEKVTEDPPLWDSTWSGWPDDVAQGPRATPGELGLASVG